jgi:hypothetical protein
MSSLRSQFSYKTKKHTSRMKKVDTLLIGVSILLFIAAPYLPSAFYFQIFGNALGAFILLLAVLISVGYSKLGSISLILAIGALFIEHRKRAMSILKVVAKTKEDTVSYEKQLETPPPVLSSEIHPPFESPEETTLGYKPVEDQSNDFEAVGSSINAKTDLEGVRLPEKTEQFLIEHGFADKQSD